METTPSSASESSPDVQVLDPIVTEPPGDDTGFPLSMPARGLLALLSIAAGTIHLVMVPSHAAESMAEGLGFALSGWFQIGFAIAIIAKPAKRWLTLGIVVNLAFIGVWAYTRVAGLPFGGNAGHAEAATFVDLTCVGLEAALILACAVLHARPRLGENFDTGAIAMASIVPIGVVVLTTAVLTSPSSINHSHGAHADHDTNVAAGSDHSMDHSNGAMDHSNGAMDHSNGAMDHDHGAAAAVPASQRCDWTFNTKAFWDANPPAVDDGTHAHHHGSASESANPPPAESADGKTVGNQSGIQIWKPMTDPAQCSQMKADLATMESFAQKYPTAQDAMNAGCIRVTIYVPGIAAHYACFKEWDGNLDVNKPEMLLYGGSQPWAPLVGLSYYYYGPPETAQAWQDGQMPFHIHEGLCVKGALVIGGDGSSKEQCEAMGGKVMGKTGNMGHYWLPSCNSPDGVFSADNPRLDMGVANYNDDPKFDPNAGGDPTVLQKNPCAGSTMADPGTFGPPTNSGSGETAAGVPTAK